MPDLKPSQPSIGLPRHSEKPARSPAAYQWLDHLSGALILFASVITPWLFGTADAWAITFMTGVGCALGLLLAAKWSYRIFTRYSPPRFGEEQDRGRWVTRSLAVLTVATLSYSFISALNARASFDVRSFHFEYHPFKAWLPATYDDHRSWPLCWSYLSLACFFWSLHDWLLGKTRSERHRAKKRDAEAATSRDGANPQSSREVPALPERLTLLLWVLSVNGALVAIQGTLQRLSGSPFLLWCHSSYRNDSESCFGPYSYRSNAAQYLNLIWPLSLGFWWTLNEGRRNQGGKALRLGEGPQLLLLPITIAMAAAPFISTSRGGALVAGVNLALASFVIFVNRRTRASTRVILIAILAVILGGAWYLGGQNLQTRFKQLETDKWSHRGEIYENSKQIAIDFPLFGTGPGTFQSVYELYRTSPTQSWAGYLHDDWLETRVTFGIIGTCLILLMLLLASTRWFVPGAIPTPAILAGTSWIALGGCLLHAKFDFPLQIYSVLLMFLINCAILFTTSRPRSSG